MEENIEEISSGGHMSDEKEQLMQSGDQVIMADGTEQTIETEHSNVVIAQNNEVMLDGVQQIVDTIAYTQAEAGVGVVEYVTEPVLKQDTQQVVPEGGEQQVLDTQQYNTHSVEEPMQAEESQTVQYVQSESVPEHVTAEAQTTRDQILQNAAVPEAGAMYVETHAQQIQHMESLQLQSNHVVPVQKNGQLDNTAQQFQTVTQHRNLSVGEDSQDGLEVLSESEYAGRYQVAEVSQKVQVHSCTKCSKTFNNPRSLYLHKKTHKRKDLQEECPKCGVAFSNKSKLNMHMKKHTSRSLFKCYICKRDFYNITDFYQHDQRHLEVKAFKCLLCDLTWTCADTLDYHLQQEHNSAPAEICRECFEVFVSKDRIKELEKHFAESHPSLNIYCCDTCKKSFNNKWNLNQHKLSHNPSLQDVIRPMQKHACTICGRKFKSTQQLGLHQAQHSGDPLLECEKCGEIFMHMYQFNDHAKQHSEKDLFKCHFCIKEFSKKVDRAAHEKLVHKLKSFDVTATYYCEPCDASFKQQGDFYKHRCILDVTIKKEESDAGSISGEANGEEKPVERVKESRILKYNDEDEDDYEVSENDADDEKGSIKNSDQEHENNSIPLKVRNGGIAELNSQDINKCIYCKVCGRLFISSDFLSKHMKEYHLSSQIGDTPRSPVEKVKNNPKIASWLAERGKKVTILYKCRQCDATFKTNFMLRRHKAKMHAIIFKCHKCVKTCSSKEELKQHLRSHDTDPLTCTLCGLIYQTAEALRLHLFTSHIRSQSGKTHQQGELVGKDDYHNLMTSPQRQQVYYECHECGEILQQEQDFVAHLETHNSSADEEQQSKTAGVVS